MTGVVTSAAPLGHARSHFAGAVHDGLIYVFGGGGAGFKSLDSTEVYDPAGDTWSPCAPMPAPRSGIAAATLGDRILVMGGGFRNDDGTFDFKSTVDVYLPREDRWESGPSLVFRHDAPASQALDGTVYLFGGHHPEAEGGPLTDPAFDVCEALVPGADAWATISPMPTPRFSLALAPVDGTIWAMGGGACQADGTFANLDTVESFDPKDGNWGPAPTCLPWPSAGPYATAYGDGLVVAGGNVDGKVTARMARYRTQGNAWEELPPLPAPRVMGMLLDSGNGLFLIGGREADAKTVTADVYRVQPGP